MGAAEHPASPHSHCDRHHILIQHFSMPTGQDRKNTKHTGTKNCSACWQIWVTPHQARSLPRKHAKALNWLRHWHGGRSLSHRQQDLCVKAHISPLLAGDRHARALSVTASFVAKFRETCHLPLLLAHAPALQTNVEEICRTALEISCLNLAAERD